MEYYVPFWKHCENLLFEICRVIQYVRNQIKKIRAEKGFSQADLSIDLKMTPGAYSKIESGPGKLDLGKLAMIAKTLEVDIIEFFPKQKSTNKLAESEKKYGYANKSDIDDLTFLIKQLRSDIVSLKKELATIKISKLVKKK